MLAGCDGVFTVDLGTSPPADPAIADVQANLLGVELRKADSTVATLEFRDSEPVDLRDLATASTPLRLFTSETLPTGEYTGIRLLFDTTVDAQVVDTAGVTFPLQLAEGDFAAMDFVVEQDKRSTAALSLALDLRQSLAFDAATDVYTLTPVLRSVPTTDAAEVKGDVRVACPSGSTMLEDGAVYLYQGKSIVPDDLDGAGAEPFATTRIVRDLATGGVLTYALRYLPAADYTLALTCQGDADALGASDDLVFSNVQDIRLGDGQALQLDLD
jgi:hypothetical protein